ncbi:MAG: T9SS type A sorting domain-containing protein [bacterium]|nr:T9SS type A sorting domain-containing protein [bacterium]
MRAQILLTLIVVLLASTTIAQPVWTSLCGPEVGDVICFYSDSTHLYAGTRNGGIFRTGLQSADWELYGLPGHTINSIVADTVGHMFVASYDSGVYEWRSGQGWALMNNGIVGGKISHLLYSRVNGNLYAKGDRYPNDSVRYYRSTNNGETWLNIDNGLLSSSRGLGVAPDGSLYCVQNGAAYRSENNGTTWNRAGDIPIPPVTNNVKFRFYQDQVFVIDPGSGLYVSRSYYRGERWRNIPQATYVNDLQISDSGSIYVSTDTMHEVPYIGVYQWNDTTWVLRYSMPIGMVGNAFHIHNGDNRVFINTNNSYVYRSGVSSFSNFSNGIFASEIHSITISPNYVFCVRTGYEDTVCTSFHRYNPNAQHVPRWFEYPVSGWTNRPLIDYHNGVLAIISSGNFFYSTNQGYSWTTVNYPQPTDPHFIPSITNAPRNNRYAARGDSIYRSINNGLSWLPFYRTNGEIKSLFSMPCTPDSLHWYVFAGTRDTLYRMQENGLNLVRIYAHEINVMTKTFNGKLFAASNHGVQTSMDSGLTWQQTSVNRSIHSLISNSSGSVFAATDTGLIASTDLGESWFSFQGSMGAVRVIELQMDSVDVLYAGTRSNGVFWTNTPTVAVAEKPAWQTFDYQLFKNYPNPFNSSTTISYSLPTSTDVELSIFDVQGRVVERLVHGNLPAGMHTTQWNAQRYPSGTYFYRLQTKNRATVQRMELLK